MILPKQKPPMSEDTHIQIININDSLYIGNAEFKNIQIQSDIEVIYVRTKMSDI